MKTAPMDIITGCTMMKPNDFIYNSDMQSLSNSNSGELTFTLNQGLVVQPNSLIASQSIQATASSSILRMAIEMSDYAPDQWWPSRSYTASISAHAVDPQYTVTSALVTFSAHRLIGNEICFVLCSTNNVAVELDESLTFRIKYRALTQPV